MYKRENAWLNRALLLDGWFHHFDEDPPPAIRLLRDSATKLVPGKGSFFPRLVLVGEAPGAHEDLLGAPFVGKSGKFLDELLSIAGIRREEAWITNVVKYRPPDNRTPDEDEIDQSMKLLGYEIDLVTQQASNCSTIVSLGAVPLRVIALDKSLRVSRNHGHWLSLDRGYRLFISYHPSAGLRQRHVRKQMEQDFLKLGRALKEK